MVGAVARALIVLARAMPGLVLALIFVAAMSIGPLPGALGLGFHSIGMVGKLLTDAFEQTDPGPARGAAGRLVQAAGR